MSKWRCFAGPNEDQSTSAANRTAHIRQKTIYNKLSRDVEASQNGYPGNMKKHNKLYDGPIIGSNGCLISTRSHEELLDITKGKYLCQPPPSDLQLKDESWLGPFGIINTSNITGVLSGPIGLQGQPNEIITDDSTCLPSICDLSSNLIVDPSHCLFWSPCAYESQEPYRNYQKYIDLSYNNTAPYREAIRASNPLKGISYPRPIKFIINNPPPPFGVPDSTLIDISSVPFWSCDIP